MYTLKETILLRENKSILYLFTRPITWSILNIVSSMEWHIKRIGLTSG